MSAALITVIAVALTAVPAWIGPHVRDYIRAVRTPESEEVIPCGNPSTSTPT